VLWTDVGGNAEVKRSMKEAVEWPLKHPEVRRSWGEGLVSIAALREMV